MRALQRLFDNNRAWARSIISEDPDFFARLARRQSPECLWIGCADSRVPASQVVGLSPGELFVHRNVANVVDPDDVNCMAVLQFAVETLEVRHVIVCGHYGCGGVQAVLGESPPGHLGRWLERVEAVAQRYGARLASVSPDERVARLCELNVIEGVASLCRTGPVRAAWERGQPLAVHGWIYALSDGLLQDLGIRVSALEELDEAHRQAVEAVAGR